MKNISVNIGGREIPLRFHMRQFRDMEEEIGNMGEVKELLLTGNKRIRNTVTAIRIMGNEGLRTAGEKADLTDDKLLDAMEPRKLREYQQAVLDAIARDEKSEAVKEENDNKERDLVREEIEQKKDPVNSHTGG